MIHIVPVWLQQLFTDHLMLRDSPRKIPPWDESLKQLPFIRYGNLKMLQRAWKLTSEVSEVELYGGGTSSHCMILWDL